MFEGSSVGQVSMKVRDAIKLVESEGGDRSAHVAAIGTTTIQPPGIVTICGPSVRGPRPKDAGVYTNQAGLKK